MTEVNSELNFAALLTENRRIDDDFVNATEWCKQFGKDFSYFWKSPEIRAFAKALEKKIKTSKTAELASSKGLAYERPGRGKKGDTWVHPLLAIKLAEWLSPEFDVLVKETFKSFIESPEEFAADILINSHNKERVERAKKRVLCSETNKQTAFIAHNAGISIGKAHNDRYNGLYRKTASQLRNEAGIESGTPLDVMSSRDLQMNSLTNTLAIEANDASLLFDFANDIRESYQKRMGKPLNPIWEEKLLRPNQAKAIAFKPEYQGELPLSI